MASGRSHQYQQQSSKISLVIIIISVIYLQMVKQINMLVTIVEESPNHNHIVNSVVTSIDNRSEELSNSLQTVETMLSDRKVSISSTNDNNSAKNHLTPIERVRLIRMVHKVVQLANEVLNLNYTTVGNNEQLSRPPTTTNNVQNETGEKTQLSVGDIIPINLLAPCIGKDPPMQLVDEYHDRIYDGDDGDIFTDYHPNNNYRFERNRLTRSIDGNKDQQSKKFKIGLSLLQEMILKSNQLKGLVSDMIRKNLIKDCLQMEVPPIFQIPKPPHNNLSETLSIIYRLLANQTAHLYFIFTEQKQYLNNNKKGSVCHTHRKVDDYIGPVENDHSKLLYLQQQPPTAAAANWLHHNHYPNNRIDRKTQQIRLIARDFWMVGNHLRKLMCYLSETIHLFNMPVPIQQIAKQVSNHTMHHYKNMISCTRKSIFECQIMRDAMRLFADVEEFLRKESHRLLNNVKS